MPLTNTSPSLTVRAEDRRQAASRQVSRQELVEKLGQNASTPLSMLVWYSMSKAFVKEDSANDDDDGAEPSTPVPGGKNYITPAGLRRLRDELNRLLDEERPAMVKTVSWAASNGDRSENGDYIYGKRKLREIDKRVRFLSKRIDIALSVDPTQQNGKKVLFGATVKIEGEDGRKRSFSIVGIDETDVAKGRISWISPLATALLKGSQGDVVTVRTPKGDEDLEILEVKYEELP